MKIIKGEDVHIGRNVKLDVDYLELGDRTVINDNCIIEGGSITFGRECWIDEYVHIGGGSCRDGKLVAGDWVHMGKFSHINQARDIHIGDEVGIGINTKIFSHGAYLSAYNGFPVSFKQVSIGNRVWIPNALVNPGVNIGDDVVVASMSLVNKDIPSGCLAGGIPAKILKENCYPISPSGPDKMALLKRILDDINVSATITPNGIESNRTVFNIDNRIILGPSNKKTETIKNQLRRYGIRFKYKTENGRYTQW